MNTCEECGAKAEYDTCEACCEHGDMESGYCLICGADRTEDLAAQAYDLYKDYRKYGD